MKVSWNTTINKYQAVFNIMNIDFNSNKNLS